MQRTALAKLCATVAAIGLTTGNVLAPAVAAEPKLQTETFHEIIQALIDAEDRQDVAAVFALFTDDAILLPPGGVQPIQGRDNVRKFLGEYVKNKMDNHKVTPTVLMIGGPNTMVDAGTWSGDLPAQNGAQSIHTSGTYLATGVLVDGKWKLWAVSWQAKSDTASIASSPVPEQGASLPNK